MTGDTFGDLLQLAAALIAAGGLVWAVRDVWAAFVGWTTDLEQHRPQPRIVEAEDGWSLDESACVIERLVDRSQVPINDRLDSHDEQLVGVRDCFRKLATRAEEDRAQLIHELNETEKRLSEADERLDRELESLRSGLKANARNGGLTALLGAAISIIGMVWGLLC